MWRHVDHSRSILFGLDFLVWLKYTNTNVILPIKTKNNIWKRSGQWQLWFCRYVLHKGSGSSLRVLSLEKSLYGRELAPVFVPCINYVSTNKSCFFFFLPAKKHVCLFWSWDQTQAPMHNKQVLLTTELHPSPGMASLYVILPLKIQAYTEGLCFQLLLLYTITHKLKCRLSMSSLCVPCIPVSIFKNDLPFVSNVLLNSISSPLFRIPLSPSFLRVNMLFFCIQIWIILQSPA